MYINGISALMPHLTNEDILVIGRAEEPVYDGIITPAQIRRMSRLMRMGVYTGLKAMEDAGIKEVDGILTATAYGANEDTLKFLDSLNAETGTGSPTSFIQSTHNVLGGQLALAFGCTGYNMTFTQRGFSFESALFDAKLLLGNGYSSFLCGAADEMPASVAQIINRMGRRSDAIAEGEMFGFFVLADQPSANVYAGISELILEPCDKKTFEEKVQAISKKYNLHSANTTIITQGEPDLFLTTAFPGVPVENLSKETGNIQVFSAAAMYKACVAIRESSTLENVLVIAHDNNSYFRCLLLQKP